MYYTIYKITNLVNGKHYIGAHKTTDLDDGYMGSGKYLSHAKAKYGIENFTKEILFAFDTSEEMFQKEKELVNEEFVARTDTYNLKAGGFGGFDYVNELRKSDPKQKAHHLQYSKEAGRLGGLKSVKLNKGFHGLTKEQRISNGQQGQKVTQEKYPQGTFKGKSHTDESKLKMSQASKGVLAGENNGQYGTCWIYKLDIEQNKKIQKSELDDYIIQGWTKGRIFDFIKYKRIQVEKEQKRIERQQHKDQQRVETKELAIKLYNEFVASSYTSLLDFHKNSSYTHSHVTLRKIWRKYIPNFKESTKQGVSYKQR